MFNCCWLRPSPQLGHQRTCAQPCPCIQQAPLCCSGSLSGSLHFVPQSGLRNRALFGHCHNRVPWRQQESAGPLHLWSQSGVCPCTPGGHERQALLVTFNHMRMLDQSRLYEADKQLKSRPAQLAFNTLRLPSGGGDKKPSKTKEVADKVKTDISHGVTFAAKEKTTKEPTQPAAEQEEHPITTQEISLRAKPGTTRRSSRLERKKAERDSQLQLVLDCKEDEELGLQVVHTVDKGRGIKVTKRILKGNYIVEYKGRLLPLRLAPPLVASQEGDSKGSFVFEFRWKGKKMCIDATEEHAGHFGRLINHSYVDPNCYPQALSVEGKPRILLVALRDILVGEELTYDYGDRSSRSLKYFPWLKY